MRQASTLWQQFEQICAIPHPSGHLDGLRAYILDCVREAGLEADVDSAGNVRVLLPATEGWLDKARNQGRDTSAVTLLQAHMDMVFQADAGGQHDAAIEPIRMLREGDTVTAQGTSLGADNGIGVAAMLAILTDRGHVEHGPLELLFTVDEELGMGGVRGMKPGWLQSSRMFNLDTEREGVLMVGCAGAVDITATYRYKLEPGMPEGDVAVLVQLQGLQGGHSGMDIHLGRGNACKLMVRLLKHAVVNYEARLAYIQADGVRNAIPREASALLTVPAEVVDDLMDEVAYYGDLYRYEYRGIETGITLTASLTDSPEYMLPEEVQDDILNSLEAAPDGVFRMMPDLPGEVETSSNLASVEMSHTDDSGTCIVTVMVRSQNEEMKRALVSRLQSCFTLGGAHVSYSAAYPGWEQPIASPLVQEVCRAYRTQFGVDMQISSVHCGLECGLLHDLYPDMEIVSFGPTIRHPHSPAESVSVESVTRFWLLLLELI